MNSGFNAVVVNPSGFKVQRQSQQMPFYFGGSQVPLRQMIGSGVMKFNRPPAHLEMKGGIVNFTNPPLSDLTRRKIMNQISGLRQLLINFEEDNEPSPEVEETMRRTNGIINEVLEGIDPSNNPNEAYGRAVVNILRRYF